MCLDLSEYGVHMLKVRKGKLVELNNKITSMYSVKAHLKLCMAAIIRKL